MLHDIPYCVTGGNRRGVSRPFCIERLIVYVGVADRRNEKARKVAVHIPALERIALAGYIVLCR